MIEYIILDISQKYYYHQYLIIYISLKSIKIIKKYNIDLLRLEV